MSTVEIVIWLVRGAGVILVLVFIANLIAPVKLNYVGETRKMDPFIREVFNIHCLYTAGTVGAMALACFAFAPELVNGGDLAGALAWFFAIFWGARVPIQFFYYSSNIKRRFPVYNVLFSLAFIYLAAVFAAAAVL